MRGFMIVAVTLALGGVAAAQHSAVTPVIHRKPIHSETNVYRPFVGTWKLVSSTEKLPDGTVKPYGFGPHAMGYLMYDATGHVCAQVVNPDRPVWQDPNNPTPGEIKTAFDGFGGYCGIYKVDAKTHTLEHIPQVPFDPNLVDKPSPRQYRFEGKHLIYTGSDKDDGTPVRWTMVWQRID